MFLCPYFALSTYALPNSAQLLLHQLRLAQRYCFSTHAPSCSIVTLHIIHPTLLLVDGDLHVHSHRVAQVKRWAQHKVLRSGEARPDGPRCADCWLTALASGLAWDDVVAQHATNPVFKAGFTTMSRVRRGDQLPDFTPADVVDGIVQGYRIELRGILKSAEKFQQERGIEASLVSGLQFVQCPSAEGKMVKVVPCVHPDHPDPEIVVFYQKATRKDDLHVQGPKQIRKEHAAIKFDELCKEALSKSKGFMANALMTDDSISKLVTIAKQKEDSGKPMKREVDGGDIAESDEDDVVEIQKIGGDLPAARPKRGAGKCKSVGVGAGGGSSSAAGGKAPLVCGVLDLASSSSLQTPKAKKVKKQPQSPASLPTGTSAAEDDMEESHQEDEEEEDSVVPGMARARAAMKKIDVSAILRGEKFGVQIKCAEKIIQTLEKEQKSKAAGALIEHRALAVAAKQLTVDNIRNLEASRRISLVAKIARTSATFPMLVSMRIVQLTALEEIGKKNYSQALDTSLPFALDGTSVSEAEKKFDVTRPKLRDYPYNQKVAPDIAMSFMDVWLSDAFLQTIKSTGPSEETELLAMTRSIAQVMDIEFSDGLCKVLSAAVTVTLATFRCVVALLDPIPPTKGSCGEHFEILNEASGESPLVPFRQAFHDVAFWTKKLKAWEHCAAWEACNGPTLHKLTMSASTDFKTGAAFLKKANENLRPGATELLEKALLDHLSTMHSQLKVSLDQGVDSGALRNSVSDVQNMLKSMVDALPDHTKLSMQNKEVQNTIQDILRSLDMDRLISVRDEILAWVTPTLEREASLVKAQHIARLQIPITACKGLRVEASEEPHLIMLVQILVDQVGLSILAQHEDDNEGIGHKESAIPKNADDGVATPIAEDADAAADAAADADAASKDDGDLGALDPKQALQTAKDILTFLDSSGSTSTLLDKHLDMFLRGVRCMDELPKYKSIGAAAVDRCATDKTATKLKALAKVRNDFATFFSAVDHEEVAHSFGAKQLALTQVLQSALEDIGTVVAEDRAEHVRIKEDAAATALEGLREVSGGWANGGSWKDGLSESDDWQTWSATAKERWESDDAADPDRAAKAFVDARKVTMKSS